MKFRDRFEAAFRELKGEFSHKSKKAYLDELLSEIEDSDFVDLFHAHRGEPHVVVTFDRRKNDEDFRYDRFDLLLVLLDALSGGHGIRKPTHQVRMLRWNADHADLMTVLEHFAHLRPELSFEGAMVLPCPPKIVGRRLQRGVYASLKMPLHRR